MQKNPYFKWGMKTVLKAILFTGILVIGVAAYTLTHITGVSANSNDLSNARSKYPSISGTRLDSCSLCHTSSIPNLNPFGSAYLANGRSTTAFGPIEALDSDGDGFTNLQEIMALTFPGDPSDAPLPNTPTATAFQPGPTATATQVPPTATQVPPTSTQVPPTATQMPPTATGLPPATATATLILPPSATATFVPPTATMQPPTPMPTDEEIEPTEGSNQYCDDDDYEDCYQSTLQPGDHEGEHESDNHNNNNNNNNKHNNSKKHRKDH